MEVAVPRLSLRELEVLLNRFHAEQRALPLNGFGSVQLSMPGLEAAGASTGGPYLRNSDNLGVFPFACGGRHGLVLGVCTGNYKDMASAVAAGACIAELSECFASPLRSEADLAPTLRKWVLQSHERIQELSHTPFRELGFPMVTGQRDTLRGIGCSVTAVAVLSHRLYGIQVGDGRAFLIREGQSKKLTIEHTLAHEPAYRSGPFEIDHPELVVVRVLGVSEHPATPDVFRLDLESEDRIVLGNPTLSHPHTRDLPGQCALATVEELLARIAEGEQWCPAMVACIHLDADSKRLPNAVTEQRDLKARS
jgi:serine/threonine protein phosphatase PrpC